jgi:DtxR family Mn-dependent transcriptional regulator
MSLKEHSDVPAAGREPESEIETTAARYLFAIFRSSTDVEDLVGAGQLTESLGVTPASVTEMSSKLDADGYVDYEKYRGVRLTNRGAAVAERVSWRFCIVTSFFDSVLDANLDEQTAFEMGFRLPREAIVRLRDLVTASCHEVCPESGHGPERCTA